MKRFRMILATVALAAAIGAVPGASSAAPRLYCGFGLDRVCRILCPKCAVQLSTAPRTATSGR
jgi:hypothetical protein